MPGVRGMSSEGNELEYMPALKDKDYGKPRQIYPDYTLTSSGLQFKVGLPKRFIRLRRVSRAPPEGPPCARALPPFPPRRQDLRDGSGTPAKTGSKVTIDWDGYTIGDGSASAAARASRGSVGRPQARRPNRPRTPAQGTTDGRSRLGTRRRAAPLRWTRSISGAAAGPPG